jgi:chromosome partitioning protein
MLLVALLNSKGGTGKTMLTCALAARAAKDFPRVGIVDLDPQATATRWHELRKHPDNPTILRGVSLASDAVEGLGQTGWDVIFFDGAPGLLETTQDCARTVDIVVIPIRSGDSNIAASEHTVAACIDAGVPYFYVINEIARANDRHAADTAAALAELGQHVSDTRLHRRPSYSTAFDVGKTGPEINSGRDVGAVGEIEALYKEVVAKAMQSKQHVKAAKKRGAR